MLIKNKDELLSHGNVKGRRIALDILEYALEAVDSYKAVKRIVHIDEGKLIIDHLKFDLSKVEDIYVVGAGKATMPIGMALEDVLGEKIKDGLIIVKRGQKRKLKRIRVIEAGHPIPDEAGLEGAKEMIKIAKNASEGDLVFSAITGGSSALAPLPVEGISLEDKKKVTELLLKSGAVIQEINAVRKHISAIKGGRLAKCIHPAEIINLTVSDVIGDPLDYITDLTVPDTSTFEDAVFALKKYGLWEKVSDSVRTHLEKGLSDPSLETPKNFTGMKVHTFVMSNNEAVCEAAKNRAEELGFNSTILSTMIEGESREAGIVLAGIAKEIEKNGRPLKPPSAFIYGGETTVTIKGEHGEGGRNQEFVLGFSLKTDGSENIVVASIGTDGTDGPTDIAGGIADGYTLKRAKEKGIDISENLRKHRSSYVFRQLEDAIFTGLTGTNVMDLGVVVITAS
ncbi:glycerate kinase [Candidatus Bathyarchaeota archaeon]|nr:glycerate kinase [Candidatus Bathyarchaeota archaeon]